MTTAWSTSRRTTSTSLIGSVGNGEAVEAGDLAEISFLSFYRQSESLNVVLLIRSRDKQLSFDNLDGASYRDASGRQVK
jgi:hypothetical protein